MAINNALVAGDPSIDYQALSSNVLNRYAVEDVQHMGRAELQHLKSLLGHGEDWDSWITPRAWFPGGYKAAWHVHLKERIEYFLSEPWNQIDRNDLVSQSNLQRLLDHALLSCTRYLVLCRIGPVNIKNGRDSLDPSNIAQLAYSRIPVLAAIGIEKVMSSFRTQGTGGVELNELRHVDTIFSYLADEDVQQLKYSNGVKVGLMAEVKRMRAASMRGLWCDAPQIQVNISKFTKVAGNTPVAMNEETQEPHKPLPDEFLGEIGKRSYWLITQLGPNIIRVLQAFIGIWKNAAINGLNAKKISEQCQTYLRTYTWTDTDGLPIKVLPFSIVQNRRGGHSKKSKKPNSIESSISESLDRDGEIAQEATNNWPPRGATQVLGLGRLLQGAHLFVTGLSTGARNSEILTLERECVQRASDGSVFANGRTYKLVRRHEGEQRDWPLPELAERAFEQQARLVSLIEKLAKLSGGPIQDPNTVPEGKALWFSSLDRKNPATSTALQALLRHYSSSLQLDTEPGGQGIRPHRLRKTLARLVALAIVQAPKLLQDIFGHKSVEMTLYYILTDVSLAEEIDIIVRELRIMRCAEDVSKFVAAEKNKMTLADVVDGESKRTEDGYGGGAAVGVRRAVAEFSRELYQRSQDWGADGIRELAEVLTLGGTTWNLVRPGVMCTKSPGQAGPCNKKRGHPDPSNCQTECGHRLEQAWLREEVNHCIVEAIAHWEFEINAQQDLVAEFWAGQVRMHINRFEDLRMKWLQDSRVRAIVQSSQSTEA